MDLGLNNRGKTVDSLAEIRAAWPRNEEDMKNITMEQYRNLMEGFTIEGSIREL